MASLRYAIPGIRGSLGACGVCGESFLTEILMGKSVDSLRINGIDRDIPVHKKCAETVIALQGPWEEIRDKFPRGPMYDCFEEQLRESKNPEPKEEIMSNEAMDKQFSNLQRAELGDEPSQKERGTMEFPRRNKLYECIPEENAIRDIVHRVELLGAHPLLTDCVVLLDQAREKLADWVDSQCSLRREKLEGERGDAQR